MKLTHAMNRTPRINRMARLYLSEPAPASKWVAAPSRRAPETWAERGAQVLDHITLVATVLAGFVGLIFVASLMSVLPGCSVADKQPMALLTAASSAVRVDTSVPEAGPLFARGANESPFRQEAAPTF